MDPLGIIVRVGMIFIIKQTYYYFKNKNNPIPHEENMI